MRIHVHGNGVMETAFILVGPREDGSDVHQLSGLGSTHHRYIRLDWVCSEHTAFFLQSSYI
jgi:hypothetical protein